MRTGFNSITRQNRVRKYIQGLRLTAITRERSCTVTEALEELRQTITKFAPQGPRNHCSEEDKVEYLYHAVVGHEWASNPLSQAIASEPADFQQMFTDLGSAWLQQQEETKGRKRDGTSQTRYRTEQGSHLPGLYYEGQGFYGKSRKFNSKSSVPRGYRPPRNFQPSASRMSNGNPGQNGLDKFGKVCSATIAEVRITSSGIVMLKAETLRLMSLTCLDRIPMRQRESFTTCVCRPKMHSAKKKIMKPFSKKKKAKKNLKVAPKNMQRKIPCMEDYKSMAIKKMPTRMKKTSSTSKIFRTE